MRIRFYIDEDVPVSFAEALSNRGVDVITTQDAGNKGNSDHGQIIYATNEKRVLLTHNKIDFIKLHVKILYPNPVVVPRKRDRHHPNLLLPLVVI